MSLERKRTVGVRLAQTILGVATREAAQGGEITRQVVRNLIAYPIARSAEAEADRHTTAGRAEKAEDLLDLARRARKVIDEL